MAGSKRPRGGVATAAAVFAAAALVLVLVAIVGPIRASEPDWMGREPTSSPSPPPAPAELDEPAEGDGARSVPFEIPLMVAAVAVLVIVVLLWRRLRLRNLGGPAGRVADGEVKDLPNSAEELRDAARDAQAALDRPDTPRATGVIEAWLALESAAASSGVQRDPTQTPTEFTAALLREYVADEQATEALLRLYHRARFAADPQITAEDTAAARTALETILRTVGSDNGAERTTR